MRTTHTSVDHVNNKEARSALIDLMSQFVALPPDLSMLTEVVCIDGTKIIAAGTSESIWPGGRACMLAVPHAGGAVSFMYSSQVYAMYPVRRQPAQVQSTRLTADQGGA